jgi:hypothetical protein
MLAVLVAFFMGLVLCLPVQAAIWTVGPSDCSSDRINGTISSAADGDTIDLTCVGTVNWSTSVVLPNTKGIKITGPGSNPAPSSSAPPSYTLTITSSAPGTMIVINPGLNKARYEISGLHFLRYAGSVVVIRGQGRGTDGLGAYRIHDNIFDHGTGASQIEYRCDDGECTGLTDHNSFLDNGTDNYTLRVRDASREPGNSCFGLGSWTVRPFTPGDNRYHFIENNYFYQSTVYQRHQISIDVGGARYVARYNTFDIQRTGATDVMEAHGNEQQGRGARGGEIYGNTILGNSSTIGRNINLRGGQWLVYNNTSQTVNGSGAFVNLTHYRASTIDYWQGTLEPDCGEEASRPLSSSPSYHRANDQIQSTYMWNNTVNGVQNNCPYVQSENYVRFYIQQNRDYFCGADQSAVGLSYTPYVHPHPLQRSSSGDVAPPAPPTGLKVF